MAGSLRMRVPDARVDAPAQPDIAQPAETTARPLRLHTPMVEAGGPGGGLGGHCFARDFARYLAHVLPTLVVTENNKVLYWWASAYGLARVRAAFLREYRRKPEDGQVAYEVATWFVSGGRTYEELMAQYGLSAYKIGTFVSRARKFASLPTVRVVRPISWRRAAS